MTFIRPPRRAEVILIPHQVMVAVLAIVLTAPLGAFAIDLSYKKLLLKE